VDFPEASIFAVPHVPTSWQQFASHVPLLLHSSAPAVGVMATGLSGGQSYVWKAAEGSHPAPAAFILVLVHVPVRDADSQQLVSQVVLSVQSLLAAFALATKPEPHVYAPSMATSFPVFLIFVAEHFPPLYAPMQHWVLHSSFVLHVDEDDVNCFFGSPLSQPAYGPALCVPPSFFTVVFAHVADSQQLVSQVVLSVQSLLAAFALATKL